MASGGHSVDRRRRGGGRGAGGRRAVRAKATGQKGPPHSRLRRGRACTGGPCYVLSGETGKGVREAEYVGGGNPGKMRFRNKCPAPTRSQGTRWSLHSAAVPAPRATPISTGELPLGIRTGSLGRGHPRSPAGHHTASPWGRRAWTLKHDIMLTQLTSTALPAPIRAGDFVTCGCSIPD